MHMQNEGKIKTRKKKQESKRHIYIDPYPSFLHHGYTQAFRPKAKLMSDNEQFEEYKRRDKLLPLGLTV